MTNEHRPSFLDPAKNYAGRKVIQPVELGQENGVNFMIQDEYEPVLYWKFVRRIKTYSEPHHSKEDFKKCEICKKYKRKYGRTPNDEIIK